MKINYVQRALVPPPGTWKKGGTLLKTLDLDYMGNSHFEGVSTPTALAHFIASEEPKVVGKVNIQIPNNEPITIRYLVRETQECSLVDAINKWDSISKAMEESAPLYYDDKWGATPRERKERNNEFSRLFYFGIDRDSEFFIWRSKFGKRLLHHTIGNSVKMLKDNARFHGLLTNVTPYADINKIFHIREVSREVS